MGNKRANDVDGEPISSKKLQSSKWNKDSVPKDVSLTIDSNDNGMEDGGFGEEVEESLQRDASNNHGNLGARLLDPPVNLEMGDVELSFQLKMLDFMAKNQAWEGREGPTRQND